MNWKIEALILALGLFLGGKAVQNGIKSIAETSRTIDVRGLSEKEVKANRATWNLSFSAKGNDLRAVFDKIKEDENSIIAFLKENNIKDSDIYENPATVDDRMNQPYIDDKNKAPRYTVSKTITVSTSSVDDVYKAVNNQESLLEKGILLENGYYNNPVSYEFTDLNSIKPQMIEEATKAAREAGQKFAKDSESKLGKIKNAQQGQFSITDRDSNTPYIKKVRVVTYISYYLKD